MDCTTVNRVHGFHAPWIIQWWNKYLSSIHHELYNNELGLFYIYLIHNIISQRTTWPHLAHCTIYTPAGNGFYIYGMHSTYNGKLFTSKTFANSVLATSAHLCHLSISR